MRALTISERCRALAVLAGLSLSVIPIGQHMRANAVGVDGMGVWAEDDGRGDARPDGARDPFDRPNPFGAVEKTGVGNLDWVSQSALGRSDQGREPVVETLLHYRAAVLANDLDAAAAALLQTSGPTAPEDILRVHRILEIRPEDTKLSVDAIAEEVDRLKLMAARSQPAPNPVGEAPR